MSYPKKGKESKLKPVSRIPLAELSELHKECIFNHEDCKKIFDERILSVKLPITEATSLTIAIFAACLPEISDRQLNLNDVDGEYEQLIDLIENNMEYNNPANQSNTYPTHPGIFLLMVNLSRQQAGKVYTMGAPGRLSIFKAHQEVLAAVKALEIPVRDACIAEFYESATQDQLDDIRITLKHRENPQGGMPGNGAIPQFSRR